MKRFFFVLALVALAGAAAPRAHAATEISVDFFYDNLDEGNWIEVGDYGYCWQPNVAVSDRSWRPYADGYWAYTDVGWTWVSYEDFGWATYHYGRWARLHDTGWVWVPGTEWGPAWVSWRTGGDYVGWAPLPPRYGGGEPIYEGRPVNTRVDIEFDIGPEYYNFVDVRYIGEPVLRRRIFDSRENFTYINNTVNVTNITYNNSVVYNYGPDYNRINAYSTRQIPRLQLQREANVDLRAAAQSKQLTRVQGNQLMVAAPMRFERSTQTVVPKVVKTKVEQPKLETGWGGINDPKRKAELQTKFKAEDARNIPIPKMQPAHPEALRAITQGASPAASATPTQSVAPVSEAVKRQKDNLSMPLNTALPTISPNESKNKNKDLRGLKAAPTIAPQATVAPQRTVAPNEFKGRARRNIQPLLNTPAPTAPPQGTTDEPTKAPTNLRPQRPVITPKPLDDSGLRTTNKLKTDGMGAVDAPQDGPPPNERKFKADRRQQFQQQVPVDQVAPGNQGAGAPNEGQGGGRPNKGDKGKKGKGEQEPSPVPQ